MRNLILVFLFFQLLTFRFLFLPSDSRAACPLQRVVTFGEESFDGLHACAIDPNGRLVIAGSFESESLQIEGFGSPVPGGGQQDVLLAVFGADGTPAWAKGFGGPSSQVAVAVDVDDQGNILIGGNLHGSIDFGGGALFSAGHDIFVAKLDPQGQHLWSRKIGSDGVDFCSALAVAPNGDVVLLADVTGDISGRFNNGLTDVYVARFDAQGNVLHETLFGSPGADGAESVAVTPAGAVILTGSLDGPARIGARTTTNDNDDAFVVRMNVAGGVEWVTTWGGSGYDWAGPIALAGDGTVYVGGTFGSRDAPGLTSPYVGRDDWFVLGLDPNGTIASVLNGGTLDPDVLGSIALTPEGHLFLAGHRSRAASRSEIFLSAYTTRGIGRFHLVLADYVDGMDRAEKIAIAPDGEVFLVGSFEGILNLCEEYIVSQGENDAFVARFSAPEAVDAPPLPAPFSLEQNHPNPFNPRTVIEYRLTQAGPVSLEVFDAAGRRVRRLVEGTRPEGDHVVVWQGRDDDGRALPSGVYRYRLRLGDAQVTRSMVLVR